MKVKICGLRDRANIDSLQATAPDFIGLIFYPNSPRRVMGSGEFSKYIRALSWTQKVGVFVDVSPEQVCRAVVDYGLDFVQLHGKEKPEYCKLIARKVQVIKAFSVGSSLDFDALRPYRSYCTYFLFDTASPNHGGTGRSFDWSILNDSRLDHPYLLSGGIGPEDATRLRQLHYPGLAGIDINSRFEDQPGIKSKTLTQKFIHEIRHQ